MCVNYFQWRASELERRADLNGDLMPRMIHAGDEWQPRSHAHTSSNSKHFYVTLWTATRNLLHFFISIHLILYTTHDRLMYSSPWVSHAFQQ